MADCQSQASVKQTEKLFTLIPVGLREASYDSPTFRATAIHFADQIEIVEKWLEAYIKSILKLINEISSLEDTYNSLIHRSIPPANVSEAVIDHDYTLLAMKRFGEGSRDWWLQMISCLKKMETNVVEPIRSFMAVELKNFKDAKKHLELTQKTFDSTLSKYVGQSKTKEPSSLREDAFQVHEARKAYLKASLDFCILVPQLRFTVDKLLVRISFDQWREIKRSCEYSNTSLAKFSGEMERVRGWSKAIESGETVFRRELQVSRREIADLASKSSIPSREIEDYSISTVAFLGSQGTSSVTMQVSQEENKCSEKHGWLFLKVISGKPARTSWLRCWFYVRNGIFGWLVQGAHSGAVEESERIGVLLCSVKPAVQEDRRFCFEVKTNNQAILVQAETQNQLMEWLKAFECAKNKILEVNAKSSKPSGSLDPAFSISAPLTPEFALKSVDQIGEEQAAGNFTERSSTAQFSETANTSRKTSVEVNSRWPLPPQEDVETGKDFGARKAQRHDYARKPIYSTEQPSTPGPNAVGGIASLISASHNILPASLNLPGMNTPPKVPLPIKTHVDTRTSTLAPTTLAISPAPTNLSKVAIMMSSEREIAIGRNSVGGIPSVIIANVWGSSVWDYINRLQRGEKRHSTYPSTTSLKLSNFPSDRVFKPDSRLSDNARITLNSSANFSTNTSQSISRHAKRSKGDYEANRSQNSYVISEKFPANYPMELRPQEAQFRILFPGAPQEDKVLLVFRATWNPNEQQEFPGRVYVTQHDIYFYSHHFGLVLTTGVKMNMMSEVTAAPGKDCDFLFLHIREESSKPSRITIKTFLDPLRLTQRRLNYLIGISQVNEQIDIENIIEVLINLEYENDFDENLSWDSGEDDDRLARREYHSRDRGAFIYAERGLHLGKHRKDIAKFHLPTQPFVYEPADAQRKVAERYFKISPKALFHVIFGDKSDVFQFHYQEKRPSFASQGPWLPIVQDQTRRDLMRREFELHIDHRILLFQSQRATIFDYQVIDVKNDDICYIVTTYKLLWHLPYYRDFKLVSKMVITHVAKSKCKLSIYSRINWSKPPLFLRSLIERQALDDSALDAENLLDIISEQIPKLGLENITKKSVLLFGRIGREKSVRVIPITSLGKKQPESQQRTLASMLTETLASFAASASTTVIMWIFAAFKSIWRAFSANWIILILLLLSTLINLFLASQGASDWWAERKAVKFMARVGVGPNRIVSKSIYLRDLDEASMPLRPRIPENTESKCYEQFRSIMNVTDMNAHHDIAGALFSDKSTKSMGRRLRRARQRLGSYRHELLIAIRVVNQVERTLLEGEWDNWLMSENLRCKQVSSMLHDALSGVSQHPLNRETSEFLANQKAEKRIRLEEIQEWQEKYCESCAEDQKLLSQRQSPTYG